MRDAGTRTATQTRGMEAPAREAAMFAPDLAPPAPVAGKTAAPAPEPSRIPGAWRPRALGGALALALETERERGGAFLLAPVLMGAGALAYFALDAEPRFVSLVAGFLLLAMAAFAAGRASRAFPVLAALLLVVAGMIAGKVETWRAGTLVLGSEISTVLTGRVVAIEQRDDGRVRLTLDVLATARPVLRHVPARVRVSARRVPAGLAAGEAVEGIVRLFPPSGPLRPGSYDFAFESYFDGLGAGGFFLRDPRRVEVPAASFYARADAWVENARLALAARIRDRIGGAEGEVAAALVAGVRAGIPEDVNEALRRTGLAHVLSISGLHMALVAATIMGVLRIGFALFPGFASRWPVKKYAAAVALAATAVYLLISGLAVAAERSFVMLAVMLVALMFDRAALTMRNLAIAALVIVALSPHEVAGPSFQMSFAATAALIGAYAWWSQRRARLRPAGAPVARPIVWRVLRAALLYAGALAMTSLIAGAATTIFGVWHFQRIAPLSLPANLAAMPIVSVFVMPFAVLGMAAMPFGLDGPFFDVMGDGLAAMIAVARWFSDRSPLDAVAAIPVAAVVLLAMALLVATLATTWLRAFALPLLAAGLAIVALRTTPDVLVAEDGRLVAVPLADGRLAVSRARPNAFTVEDWMRATASTILEKPRKGEGQGGAAPPVGGFVCDGDLCRARAAGGALVAVAATREAAKSACAGAALIILDDATAKNVCPGGAMVITSRDLARHGAASIMLPASGSAARPRVTFSISEPFRPWHEHRRFSRAARGLSPWKPKSTRP